MFKKTVKKNTIHTRSEILTQEQPFTYKEAYSTLRTNFNFATLGGGLKKIVITSSIPGEGKTTVSINLAISLVQDGKKVLLVDADLRNPSIHRNLRIRQERNEGLSQILSTTGEIGVEIRHIGKLGLDVLMSGPIPPNPSEMLSSKRFKQFLQEVESHYDYVIIDTPPVGVVSDAAIASQNADGVIMIVAQKKANEAQIQKAKQNLERSHAKVIGTVLNNYDVNLDDKTSGDSYYYYYGNE